MYCICVFVLWFYVIVNVKCTEEVTVTIPVQIEQSELRGRDTNTMIENYNIKNEHAKFATIGERNGDQKLK